MNGQNDARLTILIFPNSYSRFTAKELKAQMAERQAKQYDEALRDAEITNRMKLETERAEELDMKKQEERYADQIRYQQVREGRRKEIRK